jgi:hypothetical protein
MKSEKYNLDNVGLSAMYIQSTLFKNINNVNYNILILRLVLLKKIIYLKVYLQSKI